MSQASGAKFINESFSLPSRHCGRKWKKKPFNVCFLKMYSDHQFTKVDFNIFNHFRQYLSPKHSPGSSQFRKSKWSIFSRKGEIGFHFFPGVSDDKFLVVRYGIYHAALRNCWNSNLIVPAFAKSLLMTTMMMTQWFRVHLPYMTLLAFVSRLYKVPIHTAISWLSLHISQWRSQIGPFIFLLQLPHLLSLTFTHKN